ncbi:spinster family MFS transporter [Kineobactrum salinum]|uniref:MFS transporter n=1 Tax=Kineobactrum salinum TaxID=2708301 RepID=A0A6C0U739_9GAMM|nr:MFS transporter [Kineobactrum salinum]QIB65284.1 MFS transporter [Kineobactrum salinum]
MPDPRPQEHDASDSDGDWPRPLYAWYVVGVLMLAYTNSFIDRQILSLLIEPIRQDLDISDTQVSLLAGLAFSIFYTLMGVPIARLADQKNRKLIIATGVAVWSAMTALCGTARNFWGLFAARVGVGVGEATLSPAAFSIMADYFPKHQLARAFSVYSMGVYFGAGLAMIIGGVVIRMVMEAGTVTLPVLGAVAPWQLTFFYVGLLGLPIFLLVLSIREPLRRGLKAAGVPAAENASSLPVLKAFLRLNRWTVSFHFLAFSMVGIAIAGYMVWTPTLFIRTWGWDAATIGFAYGAIMFVFGTGGVYCGGFVADWMEQRGHRDAILRTACYGAMAAVPFAVATPLMPSGEAALVCLGLTSFLLAFPQGLPAAALQIVTPNPLRAQMTALYFLVGNLLALGFGPTLVALVTDYGFGDPQQLRYSIALVSATVLPLGALLSYLALKPFRASRARAELVPD